MSRPIANLRVLLVLSDPVDEQTVSSVLREIGAGRFEVTLARCLDDASHELGGARYDVILVDGDLLDVQGRVVANWLPAHARSVPVVVLTSQDADSVDAFGTGAPDLVCKNDITGPVLSRVIHFAVERRRLIDDIAGQRQRAHKAEERFVDFASAASDWFWEMGPDLRFTWLSANWESLSGIPVEAVVGKTREQIGGADLSSEPWRSHIADLKAHRPFRAYRYPVTAGDGRELWLSVSGVPVFEDNGVFAGYRGVGSDVTEHEHAKKRAATQQQRLEDAIESISDGCALFDAQDRLVQCNDGFRQGLASIKDIVKSGVPWIRLLTGLLDAGEIVVPEGEARDDWLRQQIEEHKHFQAERLQQYRDGRWIEIREYATRDGGRVIIRSDITKRRHYEDTVRKLTQAVEQSPASVVITDTNGVIEYVNPQFQAVTGYPRAEVIGQNPRVLKSGETSSTGYRDLWRTIKSGKTWTGEFHNRRKNGELFWEQATIGPIKAADGTITNFLAVKEDITEKKVAENELKLRLCELEIIGSILNNAVGEKSLDDVLDHALKLVLSRDGFAFLAQGSISLFDESAQELVLTVEQGLNPFLLKKCARVPLGRCHCGRAAQTRDVVFTDRLDEGHEVAFPGMVPHGHYCVPLTGGADLLGVLNLYVPDGHVRSAAEDRFVAAVADTLAGVIQARRAQMALRESEKRYRSITAAANDGIISIDEHSRVTSWNGAAERMFGYRESEVIGSEIEGLVPDLLRTAYGDVVTRSPGVPSSRLAGKTFETTALRKDASELPVEVSISSWRAGGRLQFIAITRDISDRRSLEARLAQAQKMEAVGQLTGGVAHDFNNLLTVIVGNLGLVREHIGDERLHKLVDRAYLAGKQGAELIGGLLAFSRTQRLRPEELDLNSVVASTAQLLERTLGETIQVTVRPCKDLWRALCDPVQLQNGLVNLSINARDAMPAGGCLTIETANVVLDEAFTASRPDLAPGPYVQLTVSDTGTGMPVEVVKRVFDPFFTTKEVGKGSGLGLSMVYGFVKQSRGEVEIYSEEGVGTAVKLYLPRSCSPEASVVDALADPVTATPVGMGTILVVEDNDGVRDTSVTMLEMLGYACLQAEDGPSALQVLERSPQVALMFSDVIMPGGMTGVELAQQAHSRWPDLKILLTSGYTRNALPQAVDGSQGFALLPKPFDGAKLAQTIGDLLGK